MPIVLSVEIAKTRSCLIVFRCCPFLALWVQQRAANARKARHGAKAKTERFSLGGVFDPAISRNEPQKAANVAFSAC